jgi:protein MpaA
MLVLALATLLFSTSSGIAATPDRLGRRVVLLGHSLEGRPITAVETGDFDEGNTALVVGCIHGSEQAGIAIAERLAGGALPRELDLWLVPDLNPDGAAAGTRGNANGVDLNRNFPWHWQHLGGVYYSGPRPLSEPESRIGYRLILRLRPLIAIWFHQHLDLVDESGGDLTIERHFAALVHLPLLRLQRYPGSVVSWQNATLAGTTAFVVELPAGALSSSNARRYAHAVLAVAR